MTRYPNGFKHALFEVISDAASDRRAGASAALDSLIETIGWQGIYDGCDSDLFDLLIEDRDLLRLAETIHEQVYALPAIETIAPFDGTIREHLADGQTEADWVLHEDILPFLHRWRAVLLDDAIEGATA